MNGGALRDRHLCLADGAITDDIAGRPPQEVNDPHALIEAFLSRLDELGAGRLKPGGGHPTVLVPTLREALPVTAVAEDHPVLYNLAYRELV